jgi:hypothetical protein
MVSNPLKTKKHLSEKKKKNEKIAKMVAYNQT